MIRLASITLSAAALLLWTGCERKPAPDNSNESKAKTTVEDSHSPDDGHGHDTDIQAAEPVEGEAQGHDAGDGHAGEPHELGKTSVAGYTVEVTQLGAAVENLEELVFLIHVESASAPVAVRLHVRAPDGTESLKTKAHKVGDGVYDAHVGELPPALPEGSEVVVEIETSAVETHTVTFPLARS